MHFSLQKNNPPIEHCVMDFLKLLHTTNQITSRPWNSIFMLSPPDNDGLCVCRVRSCVRLFVRPNRSCYHGISWTASAISMKLAVYTEYSLAPTDDLIGFWRTKVKVTAGRRGGEGRRVDAGRRSIWFVSRDVNWLMIGTAAEVDGSLLLMSIW